MQQVVHQRKYKVSATYADGYRVLVSFLIAGREAPEKAQTIADAILNKCERVLALCSVPPFSENRWKFWVSKVPMVRMPE